MTGSALLLVVVVVLLGLSAFFVAAEFSLVSARRTQIEPLAVTNRRARTTIRAMEQVSLMMACAQLGITVCGVLLGALGEPAVARLLEPVFGALGVPPGALHPVALAVALLLVVGAHVALGEMVPKNVALAGPETTALRLAPLLWGLTRALGPVVRGLNRLANACVRLTGREPKEEVASAFTRNEVAEMVTQSRAEGLLDDPEHQLLTSALDFDTATVQRVLISNDAVVAVPAGVCAAEVERACIRTGFSRFPVREPDGGYRGYLHIRDVVDIPAAERNAPVPAARIRPLPTVGVDLELRTALDRMRRLGVHLAQVRPARRPTPESARPAGSPATGNTPVPASDASLDWPADRLGLIALEDVLEELVGEIRDATRRRAG